MVIICWRWDNWIEIRCCIRDGIVTHLGHSVGGCDREVDGSAGRIGKTCNIDRCWVDGWMDVWMDGWVGGWTDGRTDGWMDGWMDGWILFSTIEFHAGFVESIINDLPMILAKGLTLSRWAACDVISTRAAAPSLSVLALAAVTVPEWRYGTTSIYSFLFRHSSFYWFLFT